MAETNVMNLKIFLKDDNVNEARRISVDASVATSFIFMKEKLQTVFPFLRNSSFKITWKDIDNDEITIASDEDFITAFTEMTGNVKILTVTVLKRSPDAGIYVCAAPEGPPRPEFICDVCDKKITGFRYKCLQCPDYDMCSECEFECHHSNHVMVRLPNNETYSSKCARKFMHHIARNLKKSAHCVSKEAYRAAKHASKYAQKSKQNNDLSSAEEDNQPPNYQSGCPFSPNDAPNPLGNLSKYFKQRTVPAGNDNEEKDGDILLSDVLRGVLDGFFGHGSQTDSSTKVQPESTGSESCKNSQNQSCPMDTETSPSAPLYPLLSIPINQNSKHDIQPAPSTQSVPVSEGNANPAWTFVASHNEPPTNITAPQGNQPRVEFIYHENPIIAEGLVKLHEMGFSNETGVLSNLLERYHGNVAEVVKAYLDNYS